MEGLSIENLSSLIIQANEAYRNGESIMSDSEYDQLIEELAELDPNHKLVTKSVIEKAPTTRKQKLPIPMYSLNKKKSIKEIQDWIKGKNLPDNTILVITPKYDGISLCVNEKKDQAFTRGDGEFGQQSNNHYLSMNGAGNFTDSITFGEAIISKKNWEKYFKGQINPLTKKPYSNARNTVGGLLGRDIVVDDLKHVDYVRYGLGSGEGYLNKTEQLELLSPNEEIPHVLCEKIEVEDLFHEELLKRILDNFYKEWSTLYQIDGLVLDVNDYALRKQLGREENMNPSYAIAYKNPEWTAYVDVVIEGHILEISKQGKLKGTVIIPKTIIGGVEVTNVTFYNAGFLTDFYLIKGVSISVKRSGDVIPKIVRVEGIDVPQKENFKNQSNYAKAYQQASEEVFESIDKDDWEEFCNNLIICPCCEEPVKWDETFTELVCTNSECEEMKVNKIVHFFTTVGVEEFGKPSIKNLYDNGFTTIEKILSMKEKDFEGISGWGKKSIKTTLDEFKKIEAKIPFARLLHALDLFEGKIGEKTCQTILDNSVEDITMFLSLDCVETLPDWGVIEKLKLIDGVSDITAECFCLGMIGFNKRNSLNFDWMVPVSYFESPKKEITSSKYKGFSVCMSGFRDKGLEEQIQLGGGQIVSGVSKNTTHLILKDTSSTSSKTKKAQELGVIIMSINQFNAL